MRALQREPDRLLTGMLAWSAVFGFGASAYFAGRSTQDNLPAMFFPWAFALALLRDPGAAQHLRRVRGDARRSRRPCASSSSS